MNILYLCDEYPPGRHGGIGTSVQLLAREMVKRGHHVVVAGFYDWGYGQADEENDMGVKVYRFRRKLASGFFAQKDAFHVRAVYKALKTTGVFSWDIKSSIKKYCTFLENIISRYKIDIIEMPDFNEYIYYTSGEVNFPKLSVPVVVKLHGSISYFLKEAGKNVPANIWNMEHRLLTQSIAVASVSKYTADKTALYLDYHQPITSLYNGIKHIQVPDVSKVKGRVIFTGTLVEKKGIYQLVKAWNKVHEQMPWAELFIFGKGNIEKIKSELNDNAIKSVHFKGHVSFNELLKELASAELAIFPSFAEAFALAPMEAMACGTAVIYSTYTSGPELITHGVDGWLVDPSAINEIFAAVVSLLNDGKLRNRLAEAGKKRVNEHFSIEKVAEKHEQYYQQIITGN
jgi:glycosyltransferase involved in cell wall biosynthesis